MVHARRFLISLLAVTSVVATLSSLGLAQLPAAAPSAQPPIAASPESLQAWQYDFSEADEALLDEIQLGCFNYFWNAVGEGACLAKDKTSDTVCSIAAVGFQLSSLPIGVERGWITKEAGRERALTILRALTNRTDNKKHGIYLHFLDERTGGQPDYARTRYPYELTASTVDHALLQAGAMTAAVYFGGDVAEAAQPIVDEADWTKMYDKKAGYMTMGWKASTDKGVNGPGKRLKAYWKFCSDEERLVAFLAVGAPEGHAVGPAVYYRLDRIVKQHGDLPPYVVSWNGSMFTYFFSHNWIDYRHLAADDPGQFGKSGPPVDWFENSRRATLTHRQRCIEESSEFRNFSENRWGLAPCEFKTDYLVAQVKPNVSDTDQWLGAIIPPYGAGSAIMFTPAESLAALREYRSLRGPDGKPLAWDDPSADGMGFMDSFSLDPPHGHPVRLGIDQGPLLLAIENARTGLIWRLFMQHDAAKRAVERLHLRARDETTEPAKVRRAG